MDCGRSLRPDFFFTRAPTRGHASSQDTSPRANSHTARSLAHRHFAMPHSPVLNTFTDGCAGPFVIPGDAAPSFLVVSPGTGQARASAAGELAVKHNARAYLSRDCERSYVAWPLLGRTLRFTADGRRGGADRAEARGKGIRHG